MDFALWPVIIGLLLILMALSGSVLARLPLSTAMLYLLVGVGVSPWGIALIAAHPARHVVLLEHMTEFVVLVSLFTSGLKLSHGLGDRRWLLPLRLAVVSMALTVGAIAAIAHWFLGLSPGAAVLLGAILAPTDPVLASDVQVTKPGDRDRLRFALTGEGGLNDGTAFPFVMLGLGMLGLHEIGDFGWRWVLVDVIWTTVCGLAVGGILGSGVAWLVLYLRRKHREAVGLDDFLALGLIGLSYGVALLAYGSGFLAVFAAGVALRRFVEQQSTAKPASSAESAESAMGGDGEMSRASAHALTQQAQAHERAVEAATADPDTSVAQEMAVDPEHAPAYMAHAVLGFNEQVERIGEVAVVIGIGAMLWAVQWKLASWGFVAVLLLLVRPLSVAIGMVRSRTSYDQRWLIGWFGIRGVGSIYYLLYAIHHGVEARLAETLTALTLSVVVSSIVVHGISVTPLMAIYEKSLGRLRREGRGRT